MIQYYLKHPDWDLRAATPGSGGYDIRSAEAFTIQHGGKVRVKTGLHLALPRGVVAQLCSRSGLASQGVVVANAPGIIDSDYRGEVFVNLRNFDDPYTVNVGDRIAQLVFVPTMQLSDVSPPLRDRLDYWEPRRVELLAELGTTYRGEGGHGSTGR